MMQTALNRPIKLDKDLEREKRLLPDRHPQKELFLCDLGDVAIKDDLGSMAHPIFSLSKKPDLKPRKYSHGDTVLEVNPSIDGLATIWDKDVLIFAISQLMHAKNSGEPISQYVEFNAKDFLVFSNRGTGGVNYERLRMALRRLDGTRLRTTIKTGDETAEQMFGLVEEAKIKWEDNTGRVLQWGVKLSSWLYRAILHNEVLTLHPEYFRLRSSLERRVYEIARKHCGSKNEWRVGLSLLQKKSGSTAPSRNFKINIRKIAESRTIPDYDLELTENNQVRFFAKVDSKIVAKPKRPVVSDRPHSAQLKPRTEEQAQKIAAKAGLDRHAIFEQFADAVERSQWPDNLDAAFIAYFKKTAQNHDDQRGSNS